MELDQQSETITVKKICYTGIYFRVFELYSIFLRKMLGFHSRGISSSIREDRAHGYGKCGFPRAQGRFGEFSLAFWLDEIGVSSILWIDWSVKTNWNPCNQDQNLSCPGVSQIFCLQIILNFMNATSDFLPFSCSNEAYESLGALFGRFPNFTNLGILTPFSHVRVAHCCDPFERCKKLGKPM